MDITSLIQGIGIPIIIGIVLVLLQLQLIKDELKKQLQKGNEAIEAQWDNNIFLLQLQLIKDELKKQTKIMELNNKETQ
jgi:hypothetical protein